MQKLNRKEFVKQLSFASAAACLPGFGLAEGFADWAGIKHGPLGKLTPVGRALEMEGYYVWCSCPIEGPDGKVHLFFSRWEARRKMGGWINGSEIGHAVADNPAAPFEMVDIVLAPRGEGYWDATTCHNPFITRIGDTYYLFYMGNANGKTNTKRIGLATSRSLYGPWTRADHPLLEPGATGAWDDHCTTNPALLHRANGEYWLFYKSWNTADYENASGSDIRGNRKYGLAIAGRPEGPYRKYEGNPVIDFSPKGNNRQLEDAFVWQHGKRINMIARDMGVFNHEAGLYMKSTDGIHWSEPQIAYNALTDYVSLPPAPSHLKKYGRLERPMLLLKNGRPTYLFGAAQGGKYMTSSTFIFKIG